MMMGCLALLCIRLSGRLLLTLKGGRLSKMVATLLGCLVLFTCGLLIGISCLLLVLARVISLFLLVFVHFLGSLHWPRGAGDLGVCGVSYFELLVLYEKWAGERLVIEGAVPFARRVGRPLSVSAVPVGPGIDIGRSCRFLGSLIRFLALLPGGLFWFLPCRIGANHCWLRHLGLNSVGMGLLLGPGKRRIPSFWILCLRSLVTQ